MANIKELDFKSVGVKQTAKKQPDPFADRPIGFKTPMKLGQSSDGIFSMHFTLSDQIRDNLRNLLLTNHGERVGLYDFGANLQELSLELGFNIFDDEALLRINTAVNKYMPFVMLKTLEREIDNLDNENVAKIRLKVHYDVPTAGITNQLIVVSFFVGG